MTEGAADELLQTIHRRADVIKCFVHGKTSKTAVEQQLDVSRTTVNRAFETLTDAGIIAERATEHELTLFGLFCYQFYYRLVSSYRSLQESREITATLPSDADLDVRAFQGGSVSVSDHRAPQEPFRDIRGRVDEITTAYAIVPVLLPSYVSYLRELVANGVTVECIVPDDLVDVLTTNYASEFDELLTPDRSTVYSVDRLPNYALMLLNTDLVWLGVYRDQGRLMGAISNDGKPAIQWARQSFLRYRERAASVARPSDLASGADSAE